MPKDNTHFYQDMFSGSIAGIAEVVCDHPLWTMKTRMQTPGMSFTINPRILYSGFWGNAASMAPITAAQMGSYRVFSTLFNGVSQTSSSLSNALSAFAAGFVAATIACPAEMVMTEQVVAKSTQVNAKLSFMSATQNILSRGGVKHLYAGFVMTGMRDGIFAVGYITAPSLIKQMLQPYVKDDSKGDKVNLLSKVVSGVGAAIASQAFDTVKTVQQTANPGQKLFDAIKKPYSQHGLFGYYKGGLWRDVRVASAVCIMSTVNERMVSFFKEEHQASESNPMTAAKGPGARGSST